MLKPPTSSLLQGNCLSWIAASNAALGRWPRLGCEHSRLSGDSGGWFPQGFDGDFSGMINGIYLDLLKISYFPTVKSTTWEIYIGYIEYVLRFWRSLSKFRLWLLNGDRMITMGYDMICSTIIKHVFLGSSPDFSLWGPWSKRRPSFGMETKDQRRCSQA